MDTRVLELSDLEQGAIGWDFQGVKFDIANVSFIIVAAQPGDGVKLHSHPYQEIFVVQEGLALYTVGDATFEAKAGQILLTPADVPHKFVNIGSGILRQVDIHCSAEFRTVWLEE